MAEAKVELKEIYPVPDAIREKAYIKSRAEYDKLYKRSIEDPKVSGVRSRRRLLNGSKSGTARSRSTTLISGRATSISSILRVAS